MRWLVARGFVEVQAREGAGHVLRLMEQETRKGEGEGRDLLPVLWRWGQAVAKATVVAMWGQSAGMGW